MASPSSGSWERLAPLAIVGLGGAWLAADYFRLGCSEATEGARGPLLAVATVAATLLGAITLQQKSFFRRALTAMVLLPALGALLGAATVWSGRQPILVEHAASIAAVDGLAGALAFLAPTLAIALVSGSLDRARHDSLVGAADRRAPFVIAATSIAVGAPFAVHGCSTSSWFAIPLDVSLALGSLGALFVALAVVADGRAFVEARAWLPSYDALEPRDPDDARPLDGPDLGLGDGEHVLVRRGDAYRSKVEGTRGVGGDLLASLAALRTRFLASSAGLVASVAAIAIAFATMRPAPHGTVENLRRAAERDMAQLSTTGEMLARADQLPMACRAFFTLGGGCADRLSPTTRDRVTSDIAEVRRRWVLGQRGNLEGECVSHLRRVLDEPMCGGSAWE